MTACPPRLMRRMLDLTPDEHRELIENMSFEDLLAFDADFETWAHDGQLPPAGEGWRVWLMMAGCGFGKTRAGAEWVHRLGRGKAVRIALVAASIDEARSVMVEGASGALSVARKHRVKVNWEPSRGLLSWPSGSMAQLSRARIPTDCVGPSMVLPGALQLLDTIVAAAVAGPPAATPPSSPQPGSCYLVAAAPSGEWAGHGGHIAAFTAAGWRFVVPAEGMQVQLPAGSGSAVFRSGAWDIGTVVAERVVVAGQQVVGTRAGAIAAPAGGSIIDGEARAAVGNILAALRQHRLIAP